MKKIQLTVTALEQEFESYQDEQLVVQTENEKRFTILAKEMERLQAVVSEMDARLKRRSTRACLTI